MFDALTLGLWKKMLGDSIDGLFNPRGDYSPDADPPYSEHDVVFDNGSSFRYINDIPSNEPTSSTSHWQQIAEKGEKGDTGDVTPAAESARDLAEGYRDEAEGYADNAAAHSAQYLPASNGVDDTDVINSALASAGLVRGLPNTTYIISSPLIIKSDTYLDMTGCTIMWKQDVVYGDNHIQNISIRAIRIVEDASTTALSTTILSATADFTSADVGRPITIIGAGGTPDSASNLTAVILTVVSGSEVIISRASKRTVSNAECRIYNMDSNITVIGGIWDRGGVYSTANDPELQYNGLHGLSFRHVKNLHVDIEAYKSTHTGAKYALLVGDVTYAKLSIQYLDTISDGIHINGPANNIEIPFLAGHTGDDFISLTGADYPHYSDTAGDITNVHVGRAMMDNAKAGYKILPGSGNFLDNFTASHTSGTCENYGAWVEEDLEYSNTMGGAVGRIDFGMLDVVCGGAVVQVSGLTADLIKCSFNGAFPISGVKVRSYAGGRATHIKTLIIDNPYLDVSNNYILYVDDALSSLGDVVINNPRVSDGQLIVSFGSIGKVKVNNLHYAPIGLLPYLIYGTIAELDLIDAYVDFSGSTFGAPKVTDGTISRINVVRGYFYETRNVAVLSSNLVSVVTIDGAVIVGLKRVLDYFSGTLILNNAQISTVLEAVSTNGSYYIMGSLASYASAQTRFVVTNTTAGSRRVNGKDIKADVSALTPIAGDIASNTSVSAPAGWYVGNVVYDGAKWIPLDRKALSTTVTLVDGSATITNARITATSIIKLYSITPGGTPGALYVYSITAGTGFVVKSTSATDTSIIAVVIEAY